VGPRGLVGGRVSVPTHIWKAIYDPRRGAAAYITLNRPGFLYSEISIAELARLTGIDPFPALSPTIKATAMSLPAPRPSGQPLDVGPVPEQMLGLGGPVQVSTLTGPIVPVVSERAWEVPHSRTGLAIDVVKQGYDRYRQYRDTHAVNSQPPQIN
jgi:endonuclease G